MLGEKTVFVNSAGCMTLLSIYPFTPFRGSFLYTAMASAPAGAQGVRDALVDGRVVHTKVRRPRLPVEAYLKRQGRFAHLFEPERNETLLAEIQARVGAYWSRVE